MYFCDNKCGSLSGLLIINPRLRACAARVTVVGLCVCWCIEEKERSVLGIRVAFVRGTLMHRVLNSFAPRLPISHPTIATECQVVVYSLVS